MFSLLERPSQEKERVAQLSGKLFDKRREQKQSAVPGCVNYYGESCKKDTKGIRKKIPSKKIKEESKWGRNTTCRGKN